jgi:hypothetical protein
MPGPVRNLEDLNAELSKLNSGDKLVVYHFTFDLIWPRGWKDELSRRQATEVARAHKCVIDESVSNDRALVFRKL